MIHKIKSSIISYWVLRREEMAPLAQAYVRQPIIGPQAHPLNQPHSVPASCIII